MPTVQSRQTIQVHMTLSLVKKEVW